MLVRRAFLFLLFFVTVSLFAQNDFYWENPLEFSRGAGSFPQGAAGGGVSVIAWQEAVPRAGQDTGQIFISCAINSDTQENGWALYNRVAGPYDYALAEPSILTLNVDSRGRIFICIAVSPQETEVLISDNRGGSFSRYKLNHRGGSTAAVSDGNSDALVPKIFSMSDGTYLMFVVRVLGQNMTLFYARSDDGFLWSPFSQFVSSGETQQNFLPAHTSMGGRDYIVFQSFISGSINRPSYQLYVKSTDNGGRTWTGEKRITTLSELFGNNTAIPDSFNNERAALSVTDGRLFMVWERRYGASPAQIYGAFLDESGAIVDGSMEKINSGSGLCNNPVSLNYQGKNIVVWFDNRRGADGVFMAVRGESAWRNVELSRFSGAAVFPRPLVSQNKLYIFWQDATDKSNRIFCLPPDTSVAAPSIRPVNFTDNKRISSARASIAWNVPYDSSGILGYSWVWGRSPDTPPPRRIMSQTADTQAEEIADSDGAWYFNLSACDNAGNWSAPVRVTFVRDTIPPPPVKITPLEAGDDGCLYSNTFTVRWQRPQADDLAGFAWSMDYLGPLNASESFIARNVSLLTQKQNRALKVMGAQASAYYENSDNGVWCFSVFAIDDVGNVGDQSTFIFKLNKYRPHTFITALDSSQNIQGDLTLRIIGRGFSESGNVQKIFFRDSRTRDYVLELAIAHNDYRVLSDREIFIRRIENLPEGTYYIYVEHPVRGLAAGAAPVSVRRTLTVKFGDYSTEWEGEWLKKKSMRFSFSPVALGLALVLLFCIFLVFLTLQNIGVTLVKSRSISLEALAIINGEFMPREKKRRKLRALQKRGIGLRFKLAAFTLALVGVVIAMVATPFYINMNNTQQRTLMNSLWDRSVVLLRGIVASAGVFLHTNNALELSYLPSQTAAVPEALYVTITGFGLGNTSSYDYVWASNDSQIAGKINTPALEIGVSRINDAITPTATDIFSRLNDTAKDQVGDMAASIAQLTQESYALVRADTQADRERLEDIQTTTRALEQRITQILESLGTEIHCEPAFAIDGYEKTGNTSYILYTPVLFRQSSSDIYVRGMVRLEITSESVVDAMRQGRRQILLMLLYISLMALVIGGVGAFVLAGLIINPIKKLVKHVEKIRDTDDKSELAGLEITIGTKDEIAVLGDTINDMTVAIVKAAMASHDLSIGKEVQKKFIPLEVDRDGNKLSTGFKKTKNARFFGYYEGAKGVSGDYFDYQSIDDRYFAIIKCDVAGKGIPAALIMIQVATMFINYFKGWKPSKDGPKIENLVYQINDFIETLNFKGRFAAFTLCLFDSETGVLHFCNAGDNIIHWFDKSAGKLKYTTLPQTPATGILPNAMVEAGGGYKVQTMTLDHGDILLLYTDGIEEAKRKFRDSDFNEIVCNFNNAPKGTVHGTHGVGEDNEEMGAQRVEEIINAVMNRQIYTLHKYHNPLGEDTKYHFDFTNCAANVENVIMAMVSVEKIFRMHKPPKAGADDKILVDGKVNTFLKDYFSEYYIYCNETQNYPNNPNYLYYTHVAEDEQYDDLTILGVNRK